MTIFVYYDNPMQDIRNPFHPVADRGLAGLRTGAGQHAFPSRLQPGGW